MSQGTSPLAGFGVRSRDPEFAHHELRTSYADFKISLSGSPENFEFIHHGLVAPGFAVARMRYSMGVHFDALETNMSVIVVERTRGRLSTGANRDSVVAEHASPVLMPTYSDRWWVDMDDLDEDVVVVQRSAVDRVAGAFGVAPHELAFTGMTPVSAAAARYWKGVVRHVRHGVIGNHDAAASPLVLADTSRSLATAAVTTFANSGLRRMQQAVSSGWAKPATLRRALAYIDEHAGEDIGVEDIAAAARISMRGLQTMFRRERDRTPLEEVRRVRIARAHADLQVGDPTRGDTVAAIAARWGFSNPGRFAVEYEQMYGCSPSDTLGA